MPLTWHIFNRCQSKIVSSSSSFSLPVQYFRDKNIKCLSDVRFSHFCYSLRIGGKASIFISFLMFVFPSCIFLSYSFMLHTPNVSLCERSDKCENWNVQTEKVKRKKFSWLIMLLCHSKKIFRNSPEFFYFFNFYKVVICRRIE